MKKFYITTTAPYVNASPHIGFALEITQADALARFKRIMGFDVAFGFGTDEHGLKIYRKALETKKDPQIYCDEYAEKFDDLKKILNLSTTHFIRTTDKRHIKAACEFWMRCLKNGDIYKKNYRIRYCVGCELEKTDSELVDGLCPIHPNLKIEEYEEENYFFRFSKYQKRLLKLYEQQPNFVLPSSRLKEIKTFVEGGLEDFSISRLKSKMPWGIDVPNDSTQVMYVWFDALIFYISTIGWPDDQNEFEKWWPCVQVAGKDNLRQQTAIWQAMLMSANLTNSKQVFIHGFINANNQKMSKSLGNVIDPFDLVKKYGTDTVRYYLLREIPPFGDGDFSISRMDEIYKSDLSNELGNLVLRITTLAEKDNLSINDPPATQASLLALRAGETIKQFESFRFNLILETIWKDIKRLNKKIDGFAPWKKDVKEREKFLFDCLSEIQKIGVQLMPFLPQTAQKIILATQGKIKKIAPLFPRI